MTTAIEKNAWVFAALLLLLTSTSQGVVQAQEPQEVHPFTTECTAYGCFTNWYCAPSTDLCTQCPKDLDDPQGTTQEDCQNAFALVNYTAANASSFDLLSSTEPFILGTTTYYMNETAMQLDLDNCIAGCVKPKDGDDCSNEMECDSGRLFCNYYQDPTDITDDMEDGDDAQMEEEQVKEGVCTPCKEDIRDCLDDPNIASPFGVEDCVLCDVSRCIPLHYSVTTEIHDEHDDNQNVIVPSNAMRGAPRAVGQGPLVECSNLIHSEEFTCVDGGNSLPEEETRQEGRVCLIRDYTKSSYFVSVVNKCASLGGVAAVYFQQNDNVDSNQTWFGSLSFLPTTIPSVVISYDDGERWEAEHIGKEVKVNTTDVGDVCIKQQFCSDDIPCVGSSAGHFCDFKWGGGNGGNGDCRSCPEDEDGNPDPIQCFFATGEDGERAMGQKAVESCASTCASSLTFPDCKFCPKDIGGFDFGLESESEEKCRFCPENDVLYPEREFPLFGVGVKCWHVQKFFETVDVNADARNCQLAQMMNYVCGCSGSGYAGASSDTKKAVLAWLPRIMAILSFFGSAFIIYDTTKSPEERGKVMNQLLIGLSVFDLFGSCAYAFTTLPIPENHAYGPIYGAKGNDATCTAQGFFIQMGTISAYLNVSLAVYYFLIIKLGWDDRRVEKIKCVLFLCPIVLGFTFAFAGIPFYDSLNLWCNNTASYWPDIPVAIAIGLATVLLVILCWDVYSKEKKSSKWRGGASFASGANQGKKKLPQRTTLSSRVFWQSFFYLLAFYLTWPAYLGLQYAWAGGNAFTSYGLILTAATLVPLQGFWNMLVYIRPRYGQRAMESIRRMTMTRTSQSKSQWSWLSPSRRNKESDSGHTSREAKAFASQESSGPERAVIPLPVPTDQDMANNTSIDQGDRIEEEKQEE